MQKKIIEKWITLYCSSEFELWIFSIMNLFPKKDVNVYKDIKVKKRSPKKKDVIIPYLIPMSLDFF